MLKAAEAAAAFSSPLPPLPVRPPPNSLLHAPEKVPLLIWRETAATHFPGGKGDGAEANACAQSLFEYGSNARSNVCSIVRSTRAFGARRQPQRRELCEAVSAGGAAVRRGPGRQVRTDGRTDTADVNTARADVLSLLAASNG